MRYAVSQPNRCDTETLEGRALYDEACRLFSPVEDWHAPEVLGVTIVTSEPRVRQQDLFGGDDGE